MAKPKHLLVIQRQTKNTNVFVLWIWSLTHTKSNSAVVQYSGGVLTLKPYVYHELFKNKYDGFYR